MDWHATLRTLAGAKDKNEKPVDGVSVWDAITQDEVSPRSEFLVNIDPCGGHGTCSGQAAAYHLNGCVGESCGHWKLLDGIVPSDSWYPVPTSTLKSAPTIEAEASNAVPARNGGVSFPPAPSSNSTYLFNITADPGEHTNLADSFPEVVTALRAKIAALQKEELAACNMDGGSCASDDPTAEATVKAANAWVPWVPDSAGAQSKLVQASPPLAIVV
jgi:hypothetical protein